MPLYLFLNLSTHSQNIKSKVFVFGVDLLPTRTYSHIKIISYK